MADPTCSDWIVNALADAGATHIFGGHGGALAPFVNAVVDCPRVEWVVTRNEANASLMAAAHAKLTGTLGVCIATSGPGATNLTTGLYDAEQDQCAVVAITGLKPRAGMSYSEFQDFNQSRMFAAGGLQFSTDIASPQAVAPIMRDAVARALTARTCVHIGVPVDIQAAPSPFPLKEFCAAHAQYSFKFLRPPDEILMSVAEELMHAIDNKTIIGVGHRAAHAGPEILKLAEKLHAPILTRLDAKGCVDESHPLVLGCIGVHGKPGLENAAQLIQEADLVLSFGVHNDTLMLCNRAGLQIRPMIQFEPDAACVLYHTFRALFTLTGDVSWTINEVLKKMESIEKKGTSVASQWQEDLEQAKVDKTAPANQFNMDYVLPAQSAEKQQVAEPNSLWKKIKAGQWKSISANKGRFTVHDIDSFKHCHPAVVISEASARMAAQDVLCVDTGDVTLWASLCAVLSKGQRTLSSERMGTMGYSLCAGFVASMIQKDKGRAVAMVGDGAVQMTINELGTVHQHYSNSKSTHSLIIIVFDNEMLARVHFGFAGSKGTSLGPSPDFVAIAKGYGGDGMTLREPHEIQSGLDKAFASKGVFLLHVIMDPLVKADMAVFSDNSIKMMNSG